MKDQEVVDAPDGGYDGGSTSHHRTIDELAAMILSRRACVFSIGLVMLVAGVAWLAIADEEAPGESPAANGESALPRAFIDGVGPDWIDLTEADFAHVNCDPDTWTWQDGVIHCTGRPVGVIRTTRQYTNFELVVEWRHLTSGGNSGVFLWAPEEALTDLPTNTLPPGGIEVQVLDHGYAEQYEKSTGKAPDWFTTHGDVFPVGSSDMEPFEPTAPGGKRSFPRKSLSKPTDQWNHYYVRAINGEVRLWVNGEEVSGGRNCQPKTGYLCLESEGAPVEFRGLRLRELP